jgi:hypothetical protein
MRTASPIGNPRRPARFGDPRMRLASLGRLRVLRGCWARDDGLLAVAMRLCSYSPVTEMGGAHAGNDRLRYCGGRPSRVGAFSGCSEMVWEPEVPLPRPAMQ